MESDLTPFSVTTSLTEGTKGCGPVCAVTLSGQLLALGDGDLSDSIKHGNSSANMIELAEVDYGAV